MKLKDIAQIAGVSPSTISKIVNGKDDGISDETRDRVLQIVREYHYTPYRSAKNTTKSWTIGVILRSSVSVDTTLDGIVETAQQEGYATLVFDSHDDLDQEVKNVAALSKHRVDGIIWEPVAPESNDLIGELDALEVPVLRIGSHGGDESLLLPYEEAAYRITDELIARGHKHIGCLISQSRRTERFLIGYRRCLYDNGLVADDSLIFPEVTDSLVSKIASDDLTGVISSHYTKALGFYRFINSLGYRIPEDVSLVSLMNDMTRAPSFPGSVEISTYSIRNADFGRYLCEKLINTVEKHQDDLTSFVQQYHLDNVSTLAPPPQSRQRKAIVVGSIHFDSYLRAARLPAAGTTVNSRITATYPGGKGVNQAVGMARLGHKVALIGAVGADTEGDFIYRSMEKECVDTSGVNRWADIGTGKCFIFVDPAGESMVSVVSGANNLMSATEVAAHSQLFDDCDYCLVQTEIPMDAVRSALTQARSKHVKTILKPASCTDLPDDIVALSDYLVPNRQELDDICPGPETMEDKAQTLLNLGAGAVIVTCGSDGSYLRTPEHSEYFAASKADPLDTTGAGDAFISAFASLRMYGLNLESAIQIATLAAGYSVMHEGVIPALIERTTLESVTMREMPDLLTRLPRNSLITSPPRSGSAQQL